MVRMRSRSRFRCALLAAVAVGTLTPVAPALAQEQRRVEYKLEAGDLGEALKAVSRHSGKEIIFNSDAVLGRTAPALRGSYSADEAVRVLLEDSDLTVEFRKDVIIIRGRSAPSGDVADHSTGQTDIVVTGSHIRGSEAISPTVVATREEIRNRGINDLGFYARSLPQNFSGGQNPGVVGGGGQGGSENTNSSSALNLRGLGPDATLTLLNGHRVAYDGIFQGVDISAIPLAAIARIDVVADGASALYGSDAVGGVANIILQNDFSGLVTSARLGAATDGGDVEQQYSAVGGHKWQGGGFVATIDYRHTTAITARQRSFTETLAPDATVLPKQKQVSALLSGHQDIGKGVTFQLDGYFNNRDAETCNAFQATSGCTVNGALISSRVRSYSVTPTMKVDLPHRWSADLSGTYGQSNSSLYSPTFNGGVVTSVTRPHYDNGFKSVEVNADGPLIRISGGDAKLAIGGGVRSIKLHVNSLRTISSGTTTPVYLFDSRQDVSFAYGEVSLPFVGAGNDVPFVDRLVITGAVRYENYKHIDDVWNPKFGVIYQPVSSLTLKATWGKSFKAPTLFQQGQAREGFLAPGFIFSPASPGGLPVIYIDGGNPNLKPERATTWTSTVEYRPAFIEGLRVEASYFHIRYRDRVSAPITSILSALNPAYVGLYVLNPSLTQVNSALASLQTPFTNQSGGTFDPAEIGAIVDNSLQNISRLTAQGVDIAANYRTDLGARDVLEIGAAASYLESTQQLSKGQPAVQRAGTIYNPPHWRGTANATWRHDDLTLTSVLNYIGGTSDNRFTPVAKVGSFTTFDVIARIKSTVDFGLLRGIDLTLAAKNLFNEKPSRIKTTDPASFPYDSTNYSSIGRTVSLTISKTW